MPLVATPLAVEGMLGVEDGVDLLLADTPEAFADKLWSVYSNCTLWRAIAGGAQRALQRRYSPAAVTPALLAALGSVGAVAGGTVSNRSSCHPSESEAAARSSGGSRSGSGSSKNKASTAASTVPLKHL